MRPSARPKRCPTNLVYYQQSGSALSPPLVSTPYRRDAAIGDPRKDGGPCENASLDDFAAHRGALHRAAFRARGHFIFGAGASRACAAGDGRALSGTLPTLRRRSIHVAASNAVRSAVTARKTRFFLFASRIGAIAYAPPRAASRAFCAIQAPAIKTVRAHSRAAPRAPPRFS